MKLVSFYDLKTGLFDGQHLSVSDPRLVALNTPAGHAAIAGHHDALTRRVDIATGQVIDYVPPAPSADQEWNATTKRWQLSEAAQGEAVDAAWATARLAELAAASVPLMRKAILGDEAARTALQGIEEEIARLPGFTRTVIS